jgi:hypothetical protein
VKQTLRPNILLKTVFLVAIKLLEH